MFESFDQTSAANGNDRKYYDGKYYDEEHGKTIDLLEENIYTKVVNYLYVVLDAPEERSFAGYFMEDHIVSDSTISFSDYEGNSIEGISISDVTVKYYLSANDVNFNTYGYEADNLDSITVTGNGNLIEGSSKYKIEDMNFLYAGPYKNCSISLKLNNEPITVGSASIPTKITYTIAGKKVDNIPQYNVTWKAPTVMITGTDPSPSESFNTNIGSGSATVTRNNHNYINGTKDYVRLSSDCGIVIMGAALTTTWPKMTLALSNAGNFSAATLVVPNNSSKVDVNYEFTPSKLSVSNTIGSSNSGSRQPAGYQEISQIQMEYGNSSVKMKIYLIDF